MFDMLGKPWISPVLGKTFNWEMLSFTIFTGCCMSWFNPAQPHNCVQSSQFGKSHETRSIVNALHGARLASKI